jgi:hypothetical protein
VSALVDRLLEDSMSPSRPMNMASRSCSVGRAMSRSEDEPDVHGRMWRREQVGRLVACPKFWWDACNGERGSVGLEQCEWW